jgi:tRNA(fMet)-specific endonuclease VapC
MLLPLEDPWQTLDTNLCITIINAKPQAVLERFRHHRMGEIGLCSVVAAELEHRSR